MGVQPGSARTYPAGRGAGARLGRGTVEGIGTVLDGGDLAPHPATGAGTGCGANPAVGLVVHRSAALAG